jgi:hypothetical protein
MTFDPLGPGGHAWETFDVAIGFHARGDKHRYGAARARMRRLVKNYGGDVSQWVQCLEDRVTNHAPDDIDL